MESRESEVNNNTDGVVEEPIPESTGTGELNIDFGTRVAKIHPFMPGVKEQLQLRSKSQAAAPIKKVVRFSSDTEITIIPAVETDSEGSIGSSECDAYFGSSYTDLKDLEREEGLALKCSNEELLEESTDADKLLSRNEIEDTIKPIMDEIIDMAALKCEIGDISYIGWTQSTPPSECSEKEYCSYSDEEGLIYGEVKEYNEECNDPSESCSILGQLSETSFYHMYNYFANEIMPDGIPPDTSPEWTCEHNERPKSVDSIDDEVDIELLEEFGKLEEVFENVDSTGQGDIAEMDTVKKDLGNEKISVDYAKDIDQTERDEKWDTAGLNHDALELEFGMVRSPARSLNFTPASAMEVPETFLVYECQLDASPTLFERPENMYTLVENVEQSDGTHIACLKGAEVDVFKGNLGFGTENIAEETHRFDRDTEVLNIDAEFGTAKLKKCSLEFTPATVREVYEFLKTNNCQSDVNPTDSDYENTLTEEAEASHGSHIGYAQGDITQTNNVTEESGLETKEFPEDIVDDVDQPDRLEQVYTGALNNDALELEFGTVRLPVPSLDFTAATVVEVSEASIDNKCPSVVNPTDSEYENTLPEEAEAPQRSHIGSAEGDITQTNVVTDEWGLETNELPEDIVEDVDQPDRQHSLDFTTATVIEVPETSMAEESKSYVSLSDFELSEHENTYAEEPEKSNASDIGFMTGDVAQMDAVKDNLGTLIKLPEDAAEDVDEPDRLQKVYTKAQNVDALEFEFGEVRPPAAATMMGVNKASMINKCQFDVSPTDCEYDNTLVEEVEQSDASHISYVKGLMTETEVVNTDSGMETIKHPEDIAENVGQSDGCEKMNTEVLGNGALESEFGTVRFSVRSFDFKAATVTKVSEAYTTNECHSHVIHSDSKFSVYENTLVEEVGQSGSHIDRVEEDAAESNVREDSWFKTKKLLGDIAEDVNQPDRFEKSDAEAMNNDALELEFGTVMPLVHSLDFTIPTVTEDPEISIAEDSKSYVSLSDFESFEHKNANAEILEESDESDIDFLKRDIAQIDAVKENLGTLLKLPEDTAKDVDQLDRLEELGTEPINDDALELDFGTLRLPVRSFEFTAATVTGVSETSTAEESKSYVILSDFESSEHENVKAEVLEESDGLDIGFVQGDIPQIDAVKDNLGALVKLPEGAAKDVDEPDRLENLDSEILNDDVMEFEFRSVCLPVRSLDFIASTVTEVSKASAANESKSYVSPNDSELSEYENTNAEGSDGADIDFVKGDIAHMDAAKENLETLVKLPKDIGEDADQPERLEKLYTGAQTAQALESKFGYVGLDFTASSVLEVPEVSVTHECLSDVSPTDSKYENTLAEEVEESDRSHIGFMKGDISKINIVKKDLGLGTQLPDDIAEDVYQPDGLEKSDTEVLNDDVLHLEFGSVCPPVRSFDFRAAIETEVSKASMANESKLYVSSTDSELSEHENTYAEELEESDESDSFVRRGTAQVDVVKDNLKTFVKLSEDLEDVGQPEKAKKLYTEVLRNDTLEMWPNECQSDVSLTDSELPEHENIYVEKGEHSEGSISEKGPGICVRIGHFFSRIFRRQQNAGCRENPSYPIANDSPPSHLNKRRTTRRWISKPVRIAPIDSP